MSSNKSASYTLIANSMARLERTGGLCDDAPLRHRIHAIAIPSEGGEVADEVRRIFLELGRAFGREFLSGECTPPVDVYETDEAIEIVVDVPGIDASAVRLIAKSETLLIVGDKSTRRARSESSFHLVERGFGRFARAVRLGPACDPPRDTVRLVNGD